MRAVLLASVLIAAASAAHSETFARPDIMRWGASTAELTAALEGRCAKGFKVRPIVPPFLPRVKDGQMQIDCDGLVFMGAPRWTELVIGDDRLQMVWVMVKAEDQAAIIAAMTAANGAPTHANGDYIAFEGARTAWRFKPPEVLFYARELDADMASEFLPKAEK
jgi:hypothetical protein